MKILTNALLSTLHHAKQSSALGRSPRHWMMQSEDSFFFPFADSSAAVMSSAVDVAATSSLLTTPLLTSSTLFTSTAVEENVVNAWSVNGATLNSADVASNLFAVSLLPYLALLYFLARPVVHTPKLGNFGFQFLLMFVAATIPAGILAKVQYHDILANVDWLHGAAESLLTNTKLLIISGFLPKKDDDLQQNHASDKLNLQKVWDSCKDVIILAILVASFFTAMQTYPFFDKTAISLHPEPWNALSLPTWAVHTSSIIEWLVAMKLIWEYAERSGNPRWKGMTWAMIPSHASGLCACTYHLFYNAPELYWMVNLQAALTVVGNTCMAIAASRIYSFAQTQSTSASVNNSVTLVATSMSGSTRNEESSQDASRDTFWAALILKSLILAAFIKYGEVYFQFPFEHDSKIALLFISLPTIINVGKWYYRSYK